MTYKELTKKLTLIRSENGGKPINKLGVFNLDRVPYIHGLSTIQVLTITINFLPFVTYDTAYYYKNIALVPICLDLNKWLILKDFQVIKNLEIKQEEKDRDKQLNQMIQYLATLID